MLAQLLLQVPEKMPKVTTALRNSGKQIRDTLVPEYLKYAVTPQTEPAPGSSRTKPNHSVSYFG